MVGGDDVTGFDYEVLEQCEYPVFDPGPQGEVACGDPATHRYWWFNEDGIGTGTMLLCQRHFNEVRKTEEANAAIKKWREGRR